jgi:hypothetical protein
MARTLGVSKSTVARWKAEGDARVLDLIEPGIDHLAKQIDDICAEVDSHLDGFTPRTKP